MKIAEFGRNDIVKEEDFFFLSFPKAQQSDALGQKVASAQRVTSKLY